jgi:uncharacterized RDD family membrane protein YckC
MRQTPAPAAPTPSWDTFDSPRDLAAVTDVPLNPPASAAPTEGPAMPLFALTAEDQPLVRLPVTPRRPLAVRRTPDNPRLRATPRPTEPELEFPEGAPPSKRPASILLMEHPAPPPSEAEPEPTPAPRVSAPTGLFETSSPKRRCIAAMIDSALLVGIDVAIVYFTVRMAGLDMADWRLLPIIPLALFLCVIGLAYVGVFTAIGGQTIGKMAAHIRVVSDDDNAPAPIDASHAVRRAAATLLSWLTVGLGFLPVLVGDHRALHDRLSRTRVVDLESA